jgi:hypothetical protein
MSPRARRLRNVRVSEISTVDKASNPYAQIVLAKRDVIAARDSLVFDGFQKLIDRDGDVTASELLDLLGCEPVAKSAHTYQSLETANMNTSLVAKVQSGAISERELVAKASTDEISKGQLGELIHDLSQARRKECESPQVAYSRFVRKDWLGQQLFAAHQAAKGLDYKQTEAFVKMGNSPRVVHARTDGVSYGDNGQDNFDKEVADHMKEHGCSKHAAIRAVGTARYRKERGATGWEIYFSARADMGARRLMTKQELDEIADRHGRGETAPAIAATLGRDQATVYVYLRRMALRPNPPAGQPRQQRPSGGAWSPRAWSPSEIELLHELSGDGDGVRDCAHVLSRSIDDVRRMKNLIAAQETQAGDSRLPATGARGGRCDPAPARRAFCAAVAIKR